MEPHARHTLPAPACGAAPAASTCLCPCALCLAPRLRVMRQCRPHCQQVRQLSRLYESAPAYVTDQPPFLNAAALVDTALPPLDLLRRLKDIEVRPCRHPNVPHMRADCPTCEAPSGSVSECAVELPPRRITGGLALPAGLSPDCCQAQQHLGSVAPLSVTMIQCCPSLPAGSAGAGPEPGSAALGAPPHRPRHRLLRRADGDGRGNAGGATPALAGTRLCQGPAGRPLRHQPGRQQRRQRQQQHAARRQWGRR